MPDGESQSAITARLNRLFSNPQLLTGALPLLTPTAPPSAQLLADIASKPLPGPTGTASILGSVVAPKVREEHHIRAWPPEQADLVKNTLIDAITNGRQVAFDWQATASVKSTTIRDFGYIVTITFRSPPEY